MTWNLVQSKQVQKANKVRLTLQIQKSGFGKFWITMPSVIAAVSGFEDVERCNVFIGADENTGKWMIQPDSAGALHLGCLKSSAVVRMDAPQGTYLAGQIAELDYQLVGDKKGLVVAVPEWARPGFDGRDDRGLPMVGEISAQAQEKPGSLEVNGTSLVMGKTELRLTPSLSEIMRLLIENFGKLVRYEKFMHELYSNDVNGGANQDTLKVHVWKLRDRLKEAKLPLTIIVHHGLGFELRRPVA
jgi:DNA-binding winged helix-turn-helix (wHTH) protein